MATTKASFHWDDPLLLEQAIQNFAIFETAVHALAEERHDGVSRIAEQTNLLALNAADTRPLSSANSGA